MTHGGVIGLSGRRSLKFKVRGGKNRNQLVAGLEHRVYIVILANAYS